MPKQRRSAQRWNQRFGLWWTSSLTVRNLLVWLLGGLITAVLLPPLVLVVISSNYEAKFAEDEIVSAKHIALIYTSPQLNTDTFVDAINANPLGSSNILIGGELKSVNETVAQRLVEADYDPDTIKVDYTYVSPVPLCKYIRQNFPNQRLIVLANRWEIHRLLFACSSLGINVEGRLVEPDWNLAGIMANGYQLMGDLVQIHLY